MRRKYDLRNKRNFVIILILSIIIIGIFSLFIYKYKHTSRIEYAVGTGSIVQDESKNFISIADDATLKVRWNGNYYLIYQDEKISLGKKVIVYDTITGGMKLYGKFYEINEDGKIIQNEDETVLANTTDTKFYKLSDREYLLVDRQITSSDRSIDASSYLLVELDRMGNAKLSNYKLNLKTINPTTLLTSNYSFDIANEILKFNSLEVDLKKIIGSTNEYKEDEETKNGSSGEENDGSNSSGNGSMATNNQAVASNTGSTATVVDNTKKGIDANIEEIIAKTKMTSIIRVQEGLTQVDVDYVIYDPYNEYKSVYAEITKDNAIETVYLTKNDTHIVFDGLVPNKEYNVSFIYTTIDSDSGETIINKFEELTFKTKKLDLVYTASIYKISSVTNKLIYKVYLQDGYTINSVNVNLSFDYREYDSEGNVSIEHASIPATLSVNSGDKVLTGTYDITGYDFVDKDKIKIKVVSVSGNDGTLILD